MKNNSSDNEFKVVKILDEYTVIINAGERHGVTNKDEFQILDKKGSEVKDPDTGEIIGRLDLIKATVSVSEVQDKMCICSSPLTIKLDSYLFNGIGALSKNISFSEKEKLNVELTQVTGGLRKSNEKIRIGDTVRLIKSTK